MDGNIGDARIFRQVQASRRIIALGHVFLYCSWQLVWWLKLYLWGASTPPFISERGEVTRKITESVTTRFQSGFYFDLPILYIFL
jgi:hypothetical protein